MPGQARLGDNGQVDSPGDKHGCPACPHPAVGPAILGSPNVFVNGMPAIRKDDIGIHAICCGPNMWKATAGCDTVLINGKPAHRKDDAQQHCGGNGKQVVASSNVIVGDGGGGGGGGAGGGAGSSGSGAGGTAQNRPLSTAEAVTYDYGTNQNSGADGQSAAEEAPAEAAPAEAPPEEPTHYVEVEIVDQDGLPVEGVEFELEGPDGTIHKGTTDASGKKRMLGLQSGSCKLRFPGIDAKDWVKA